MGWDVRVMPILGARPSGTPTPSRPETLAQWSAGPQGLRWLTDLCYQGHALRIATKDADTERYVLSAAVLRNAIYGNAVFADASDLRETMTEIIRALRELPPPELVFVEAQQT